MAVEIHKLGGQMSDADKQMRALARLRSLKSVLESTTAEAIPDNQVNVFHEALDRLRESGEDIDEFRYPKSEIWTSFTGPTADRNLLLVKVTSVLEYFAIRAAVLETAAEMHTEPSRMIGFDPPNR
jgi:hypothetical protein